MEVNPAKKREIEPHDFAASLVPQLSSGARFDVLLVSGAPIDVLGSDHRCAVTHWSCPGWLRDLGTLLLAWTLPCWVRPILCLGSAVEVALRPMLLVPVGPR